MRSIPFALLGETFSRIRWGCLVGILGSMILPNLLFALLRSKELEVDDPSMRVLLNTFMVFNALICGATVTDIQGLRTHHFVLPISNLKLVAWNLIPRMVIAGLEMLFVTAVQNEIFHQTFPVWGPALFASTVVGVCWATYWFARNSVWQELAVVVVGAIMAGWYILRFCLIFKKPADPLLDLSTAEFLALLLLAVASYFVGTVGVARARCGERLKATDSLRFFDWFTVPNSTSFRSFRTPLEAHFWFEWTRKGRVMPLTVIVLMLFAATLWLLDNREPRELVNGFLTGGFLLSFCTGMIGVGCIGNHDFGRGTTSKQRELEIGHFLASRPLTNVEFAYVHLKLIWRSVLVGWTIWAAAFLIVSVSLLLTGFAPRPFFSPFVRWWYFPATLLAWWTTTAFGASLSLPGRNSLLVKLAFTLYAVGIAILFFSEWLLPPEVKLHLFRIIQIISGVVLTAGSAWLFRIARRHKLIGSSTTATCLIAWVALTAMITFDHFQRPMASVPISILLIGFAALSVAPFAATPLAISWNRNR